MTHSFLDPVGTALCSGLYPLHRGSLVCVALCYIKVVTVETVVVLRICYCGLEKLLYNCYRNSLDLAKANDIRTIAFPAISTGTYRYPLEEAAEVAVRAVYDWLYDNPFSFISVVMVYSNDEKVRYHHKAFKKLLDEKTPGENE